jgi:hypothetical protein
LARFQKPFCRVRPQKRPSIPCSCSKRRHAQAERSQPPALCLVILSAGCWVLAGWTEAQSLRRASQLCRRGSKLGQVQKGKTKIAEKLQRHRTAPTDTYSRRVKKRRTAPPTGLQLSWRTVAVAAKFSSKIVPPPGMQVQVQEPWPCRVRRSALFYAPCSLGLGLWGGWVFDIGDATPCKDGADGLEPRPSIRSSIHLPKSSVLASGSRPPPCPSMGSRLGGRPGSPARCAACVAPRASTLIVAADDDEQ